MRTVGRLIRARRTELCLTLRQVAEAAPCAESYLSQIETERRARPPSARMLSRLERALRLDPGTLTAAAQWQGLPAELRDEVMGLRRDREIARRMARLLRRAGLDRSARGDELRWLASQVESASAARRDRAVGGACAPDGDGGLAIQAPLIREGEPGDVVGYVSVPGVEDADAFAMRVEGDAMSPRYVAGDIVVFSPGASAPPGSDCFVRLEPGGEALFRRVFVEDSGDGTMRVRLQPLNPAHRARVVECGAVAGRYAAVCVVRALGGVDGSAGVG